VIVEWRFKSVGPVCKLHAGPCFFEWVPSIDQMELFDYLDSVVSVSGEDSEDRVTYLEALSPTNPSTIPF